MKRTKIVCTIGPSSDDEKSIKNLIKAGMDVARLNFSHGDHKYHEEVFNRIRSIDDDVAIGIDISGPKIRLGEVNGKIKLEKDKTITLTTNNIIGDAETLPVNYKLLPKSAD